jgi:methyltransferase (TIGR00027 family)
VDPVSLTALWMAAVRAREAARPDRLFDDPLAEVLAGPEGFDLMTRMEAGLPENPAIPIRTRFFDDALVCLLADHHEIGQVVMLAAGMDTRAYRLDLPTVFEVDRPALLEMKDARLAAASAQPRCPRMTVGADLTGKWLDDLVQAGFRAEMPSVFLAEGLLGYLGEPEVHRLLDVLGRTAAAGSFLLADVSGRSALDAPYLASWFQRLASNGITGARFGTDDPEGLLAARGWDAHVTQYGDEEASFGRWPYPPTPRDDPRLPHNYLIIGKR